jgi:hypothetical protein
MYDDDGKRVTEPSECRRFFAEPEGPMVAMNDEGDNNKIRLILGETDISSVRGLVDTLRTAATKYNMIFNITRRGHKITPADYATKTSVNEDKKEDNMMILEGMYGTTRSSYLKLENARMIVRHSKKIDENVMGSRGRNIEQIFVENAQGERFLFPTANLAGGRAMTQHINHGGTFADQVGSQITRIANDFQNLGTAASYMGQNAGALAESVGPIREACKERLREMRKCFEKLSRSGGYPAEARKLEEQANMLNEGDEFDFTPHVKSLRNALVVEGKEIDDTVLKSVAEAMKHCGCEPLKETGNETVKVFGRLINKAAWDELISGHIEFMQTPSMPSDSPGFTNKDSELRFKLGLVIPQVRDDTLMTFLSFVSDQLDNPRQGADLKNYRRVANAALKAAGMDASSELAGNAQPIREFNEWLNSFDTRKVLAPEVVAEDEDGDAAAEVEDESAGDDDSMIAEDDDEELDEARARPFAKGKFGLGEDWNDPTSDASEQYSQDSEDYIEELMNDFSASDFLDSDYATNLDWKHDEPDKTQSKEYILSCVTRYLEGKAREAGYDNLNLKNEAKSLIADVINMMSEAGYTLVEGSLDKSDVLLPTNQGEDLKREVSAPTDEDPMTGREVATDGDQVDRLRTLAGVTRN